MRGNLEKLNIVAYTDCKSQIICFLGSLDSLPTKLGIDMEEEQYK